MRQVPVRRCLACRRTAGKPQLVRLAVVGEAVVVDPSARQPGRGAYLCHRQECLEAALRRGGTALARSLRQAHGQVTVDEDDIRTQWSTAAQSRVENQRHVPLEEYS